MVNHLALQATQRPEDKTSPASQPDHMASGLRFYGDEFVFDTVSGMFFRLSSTASFILKSLVGGTNITKMPALMEDRYGIDHSTATRDIQLFLNELSAIEPLDRFVHDNTRTG